MQYHKVTIYSIRYNEMQCNTIEYWKIAYDTFQTKTEHYWPQKGPFWGIGDRKRPAEQQETEGIQSLPQEMGKL